MRRTLTIWLALVIAAVAATPTGAALACRPRSACPFFGLGAEHGNVDAGQRASDLDRQAATGIGTMRENIRWDQIERSAGKFDFSRLDAIVRDMAARKLQMLPTLVYAPDFYTAKPTGATGSTQYPPKDPATLAAFATKLVKRYGPRGTIWCTRLGLAARSAWPREELHQEVPADHDVAGLERAELPGVVGRQARRRRSTHSC